MAEQTFADRLRELIGERSVNAFAHLVGLNESLLRKYLKGADPGLARANQIAERANCSLEWLATGAGFPYRHAEVVDMAAVSGAVAAAKPFHPDWRVPDELTLKHFVAAYQFLRSAKKADGYLDVRGASLFLKAFINHCGANGGVAATSD